MLAESPYTMSAVNGWINMTNLGRYGTDYSTRAFMTPFIPAPLSTAMGMRSMPPTNM
jgi:hypothetical protein